MEVVLKTRSGMSVLKYKGFRSKDRLFIDSVESEEPLINHRRKFETSLKKESLFTFV